MPGTFSDFLENKVLDSIFRATTYTPGNNVYIGLFTTTAPNDAGGGTEVSTTGTGYNRVSVNTSSASSIFSAASAGATSNTVAITFPQATASWGTITAIGIYDSGTVGSGNLLAHSTLTTSKSIAAGDTASFAIGDLTISLD